MLCGIVSVVCKSHDLVTICVNRPAWLSHIQSREELLGVGTDKLGVGDILIFSEISDIINISGFYR